MQFCGRKLYIPQHICSRSYIPRLNCIQSSAWTTYLPHQNRIPLYSTQYKDGQQRRATFPHSQTEPHTMKKSPVPDSRCHYTIASHRTFHHRITPHPIGHNTKSPRRTGNQFHPTQSYTKKLRTKDFRERFYKFNTIYKDREYILFRNIVLNLSRSSPRLFPRFFGDFGGMISRLNGERCLSDGKGTIHCRKSPIMRYYRAFWGEREGGIF